MDLQVERWPVDRLIPYARNRRTHFDEQIAQIARGFRPFLREARGLMPFVREARGNRPFIREARGFSGARDA